MPELDANQIHKGLWQGGRPPYGTALSEAGFDLLVLCAFEFQPPQASIAGLPIPVSLRGDPFPGVSLIHAPNDDDYFSPPTRDTLRVAVDAADKVTKHIQQGGNALVTCWQGWNRSGLVSALVLHKLLGWGGSKCAQHVAFKRKNALSNPQFTAVLSKIPKGKTPLMPLLEEHLPL